LRTSLRNFADLGGTVFVSSHLISELEMFADDLVVVGGGKLLTAEPVATTLARGDTAVVVHTAHAVELARLLDHDQVSVEIDGDWLTVRNTTLAFVSQVAFDHRIRVAEITENSRSLEEILLDITGATAEFASA
jgi:ABC-2 type transport system ATP-binding protein